MSSPVVPCADWELLTSASHPNGLVIGSDAVVEGLLAALRMSLAPPVSCPPIDGAPWRANAPFRTLILHPVDALDADQQRRLFAWTTEAGSDVQIISAASAPLFPLVQSRRFLEALYYRLNVVYVVVG